MDRGVTVEGDGPGIGRQRKLPIVRDEVLRRGWQGTGGRDSAYDEGGDAGDFARRKQRLPFPVLFARLRHRACLTLWLGRGPAGQNGRPSFLGEQELDLHYYSIIYEAIDEVKAAITGMLGTETKETIVGLAEVRDVFRSSKFGAIAGCLVVEGHVKRANPIRVLRDNVVVFEGELESLRRFKDNVNEVVSGTECGIGVKMYNDIKPGDQIECFERTEVARTLK